MYFSDTLQTQLPQTLTVPGLPYVMSSPGAFISHTQCVNPQTKTPDPNCSPGVFISHTLCVNPQTQTPDPSCTWVP